MEPARQNEIMEWDRPVRVVPLKLVDNVRAAYHHVGMRLDQKTIDTIREQRRAGMSVQQIADRHDVSLSTVSRYATHYTREKIVPMSATARADALAALRGGASYDAAAELVHRTHGIRVSRQRLHALYRHPRCGISVADLNRLVDVVQGRMTWSGHDTRSLTRLKDAGLIRQVSAPGEFHNHGWVTAWDGPGDPMWDIGDRARALVDLAVAGLVPTLVTLPDAIHLTAAGLIVVMTPETHRLDDLNIRLSESGWDVIHIAVGMESRLRGVVANLS